MISRKDNRKTLLDLYYDKSSRKNIKGKRTFKDGVNQRADIKQDLVITSILNVVDNKAQVIKNDLCFKQIVFSDLNMIDTLNISYYTRNNLFSRIFDLIIESTLIYEKTDSTKDNIEITIKYNGKLKASDVTFEAVSNNPDTLLLAKRLNMVSIIKDRIFYLELLDFKLKYNQKSKTWYIGLATGKGSSIWMLFPPTVMLTPFNQLDAIKMLELFQLVKKEIILFNS